MAQYTKVINIDDLTGMPGEDVKMVEFALDGVDHEIDLDDKNEHALRDLLAKYIAVARRTGRGSVTSIRAGRARAETRKRKKYQSDAKKAQNARIRNWAWSEGYDLSTHGRITTEAREGYFMTHNEAEIAE